MLLILLTAAAYFYFNWQYFRAVKTIGQPPRLRIWLILTSFVGNYLFFYVCSVLEFPLILNWFLLAFLLFF